MVAINAGSYSNSGGSDNISSSTVAVKVVEVVVGEAKMPTVLIMVIVIH